MYASPYYPAGAYDDPAAPYNRPCPTKRTYDVTVQYDDTMCEPTTTTLTVNIVVEYDDDAYQIQSLIEKQLDPILPDDYQIIEYEDIT